jgi:CheY-like chemotaxis protein
MYIIYVADDDPVALTGMVSTLRGPEVEPIGFKDGHELLQACTHATPAAIVIDVRMGDSGAFAVIKALPSVPMVLISADWSALSIGGPAYRAAHPGVPVGVLQKTGPEFFPKLAQKVASILQM